MWKNILEPRRPQMTVYVMRYMRTACCVTKATNTFSDYVRVILTAFPLQQWLHEGASKSPCTYIACLANSNLSGSRQKAELCFSELDNCCSQLSSNYVFFMSKYIKCNTFSSQDFSLFLITWQIITCLLTYSLEQSPS